MKPPAPGGRSVERRLAHELAAAREALAAVTAERDGLIGATPEHAGPYACCTDCGRRMVWSSRTSASPAWMCPECVYRLMRDSERVLITAEGARDAAQTRAEFTGTLSAGYGLSLCDIDKALRPVFDPMVHKGTVDCVRQIVPRLQQAEAEVGRLAGTVERLVEKVRRVTTRLRGAKSPKWPMLAVTLTDLDAALAPAEPKEGGK